MPRTKIGPLFKHFGSKLMAAKLYPAPEHKKVIEPFAGSAGYSLNHAEHDVQLWDVDTNIANLWKFLIGEATQSMIMDIPLNLSEGLDIRTLDLNYGQKLLLKHWQRTNNTGNCWTISSWGSKPGQWTANTRSRVAEQISAIKHWTFQEPTYNELATWFLDPPYQNNYAYGLPKLDFDQLGLRCQSLRGLVIVCEGGDTAKVTRPSWLDFTELAVRVTSRRGVDNTHHCQEYVWINRV